jgi:dihydroflavonol-4-reductase
MSIVLVTGGSGFIGVHCILQLLEAGHTVRTTVRSLKREADVRAMLKVGGVDAGARLSFVEADLERDAGWAEAVAGCEYVLHVASPLPPKAPKHEDELIVPAREGTLRALRFSRDAGVKRVVVTSSFAAIGYGHPPRTKPFDETDWTDPDSPGLEAYPKSKTVAELAAWEWWKREGGSLELSVVNPVAVLGPVLAADYSSSILLVERLMAGKVPGCPKLWFGVVDVRDVADLHLRAMTDPKANGERFLAAAGEAWPMVRMAKVLRERLGEAAKRVPTREVPNWVVRLVALRDPAARLILAELGKVKDVSHAKAERVLGWRPRSNEEAVVATGESLLRLGLL